jgi:hypothetical protein
MADQREVLEDSIGKLLKTLDAENYNPSGQEDIARSVLHLAEAHAWLGAPNNAHGGTAAAT